MVRILSDKSPEETEERQKSVAMFDFTLKSRHFYFLIPGEILSCLNGFDRVPAALWQLKEHYNTRLAEIIYQRVDEVTQRGDVHSALSTHPHCVSLPLALPFSWIESQRLSGEQDEK